MTEPPNPVKLNVAYAVLLLFKKALASSVWIRFLQTIGPLAGQRAAGDIDKLRISRSCRWWRVDEMMGGVSR